MVKLQGRHLLTNLLLKSIVRWFK